MMAFRSSPRINLLFLTIGTLIALLVSYLWLLPAFPSYAKWINFFAWLGLIVCFAGSIMITWSMQNGSRSNMSKALIGLSVGLALTFFVFVIYLAVATAVRGA